VNPSPHQVFHLTTPTRTRTVALTMVALMLASSLVVIAPATSAQDTVPTKPGVVFEPIPNLRQFFYARYDNVGTGMRVSETAVRPPVGEHGTPILAGDGRRAGLRVMPAPRDEQRNGDDSQPGDATAGCHDAESGSRP